MLQKKEYDVLNGIIKDVYQIKNSNTMREKVLRGLKNLIDFKFSVFSLGLRRNKVSYLVDSVVVSDFEKAFEDRFINLSESQYEISDYATWLFQIPESIVYKDSEIVNDELRRKTYYYKDYLLPNDLPNIAGISIANERTFLGAMTLYKSQKVGDFNEKDMFILNFLLPHLEARLSDDEQDTANNRKNISYLLKNNYGMTSREVEIIGQVFHGKTNEEIALELVISSNTVKKHLSHIYEKLGLSNRSQLVQFLLDHEISDILV